MPSTRTFASLAAGGHTLAGTAQVGWNLTGLTCANPISADFWQRDLRTDLRSAAMTTIGKGSSDEPTGMLNDEQRMQ